jgi:uncharacterized protein YydD (DUF2326 family)
VIRPELVRTEERVAQLKTRIDNFRVLDSYREMADQVSQIKNRMTEVTVELALVKETIAYLANSIREEKPPAYAAVETLYSEAGIQLPEVALRRFDEVREFQHSVISNRRRYLEEEIEAANANQRTLESELASADIRKSEILVILDGKGAFEDLMAMHEEFATNSSCKCLKSSSVAASPSSSSISSRFNPKMERPNCSSPNCFKTRSG